MCYLCRDKSFALIIRRFFIEHRHGLQVLRTRCWIDWDQQGIWRHQTFVPLPGRTFHIWASLERHAIQLVAQRPSVSSAEAKPARAGICNPIFIASVKQSNLIPIIPNGWSPDAKAGMCFIQNRRRSTHSLTFWDSLYFTTSVSLH